MPGSALPWGNAATRRRPRTALLAGTCLGAIAMLAPDAAHAVDGTWTGLGSEWTTGTNWSSTPTVPDGTATFTNNGAPTSVTISANTSINTIQFNAGAPAYSFTLQGAGTTFTINGTGIVNNSAFAPSFTNNAILQFSGTSTAGNATITNNGTVRFSNTSTAGNATITINGGAQLQFFNTSTADNATITNNSLLEFFNTSTAGNATITNNNIVTFRDASTAGNATITNNGFLNFVNTSTGGAARLINGAGGTIELSQLTSAGMTAGSIEGAGAIFLGSKNLAVGGNNLSTTFSGVLQDGGINGGTGGSLTKTGTGTLTLSGINTYTGATTVDAGTLLVNGSIATSSLTTVNAGGTLGGIGIVGNTTINGGGTFAPGSGGIPGTMTVQGNLAFQSGALYLVQVNPATASSANVTGTATLAGTVQAVFAPGSYVVPTYTVLHANSGLGGTTFSGLATTNIPANFNASLSYTATDVLLNLTAALGAGAGLNGNQQNVAGAINGFFNSGGALPPGFAALFGLTGGNLANAPSLLSGEAATGAQQGVFQLGSQFLGLMLDPFVDGRGGIAGAGGPALGFAPERATLPEDIALAYAKITKTPVYKAPPVAAYEPRWNVWGGAYGGDNKTDGDPLVVGSHDLTARTAGFAAGMDYRLAPGTVAGFALAGGGTRWDLAQGLGGGRSDAFQAGVYAATRSGPAYLAGALAFSNHWMSTDRLAPFGSHLTADFDAQSFGGRLEGGYRFGTPAGGITPYAAVQAQSFRTPSYREIDVTGVGFGLTFNERNASATRSELGARFDHVALVNPTAVLTLRGRLAWAQDWVSNPSLNPVFQALPGASFIVNGALPAKHLALASAGAELKLANGVAFIGKLDGEFAEHAQTYAGTGTVRWSW